MPEQWYYSQNGERRGPVSWEQLKGLANVGDFPPTTLVWKKGMPDWATAQQIPGLLSVGGSRDTGGPQQGFDFAASASQAASVAATAVHAGARTASKPTQSRIPQSDPIRMEDGGDLGVGSAVKIAVEELKSLDYGFLVPYKKVFSKSLLRKKAVRWVVGFGLFPLILLLLRQKFEWTFEQCAWWLGGYFCLLWATYFHGILRPDRAVWQRGAKWASFTIVIGIPLLFVAQELPIIRTLYTGLGSESVSMRLMGFVLGVGILEETCKALPLLLFALRKKEVLSLKDGVFLGMMSGFGFALAEVVQYSVQYWRQSAFASTLAIANAVDSSMNFAGQIDKSALAGRLTETLPQLTELYGGMLLAQIVRFMTLPLLHACWAGIVGWFVAVASRRMGKPWPIVIVGILFVATLHGMYDVFSGGVLGIGLAALSFLTFMCYLLHGQEESFLRSQPE